MERRHALKHLIATVLAVIVVWDEELVNYFTGNAPQLPLITGTADVVLAPATVGPYALAPMALTWTNSAMYVREGGSSPA